MIDKLKMYFTLNSSNKIRVSFFVIVFTIVNFTISVDELHSQNFRSLNFECAGYVTGVFPVKYNPQFLPSINNQTIYVRTDIGGIYKSIDNGNNWKFISNFRSNMSPSELMIQGIAVKKKIGHHTNNDTLIVAWGNNPDDAVERNVYRSLWKSNDGGNTWTRPTIEAPGLVFSGNKFKIKIGGECIIYHPDSSNILFAGGISPIPGLPPNLYKSSNGGDHWFKVTTVPFQPADTITCISMIEDRSEIWIGTTRGVYRSNNHGVSWTFMNQTPLPAARRILLQKFGTGIIAYVAYGNESTHQSIARYTSYNNSWKDLSANFDNSIIYGNNGLSKKYFSALTFVNNYYGLDNVLLAGRYERPLRISFTYGEDWTGNGDPLPQTGEQVVFRYKGRNGNFPNHQHLSELRNFIYTGLNHVVQNPNTEFSSYWYSSGGAGAFRSDNGGLFYVNTLEHSTWDYMVNGMSMPVVYDISFDEESFSQIQIPISDWTNAYTTQESSNSYDKLKYDRQPTNIHECNGQPNYNDTYITNVTRALVVPASTSISYNIGGNVYYHAAKMYQRINGSSIQYKEICDLPWSSTPDRVLSDGLVFSNNENIDKLILLLGASQGKRNKGEPGYNDLGVYQIEIDRNSGSVTSRQSNFMGSRGNHHNTQVAYLNSQIPPLGTTSELFSNQFNLAKSETGRIFLYLEGIAGNQEGGGFFISNDTGTNWQKVSDVVQNNEYKDEGCLKYSNGTLYLAIKNRGLYFTPDRENDTAWNFEKLEQFVSAEQVEVKKWNINHGYKQIYVFGRMAGDRFNKIYRADINSIGEFSTWQEIAGNIPSVRSLRINPNPLHENELWIATSGQGVLIYEHDGNPVNTGSQTILPIANELSQNFPNPFNPNTKINFSLPRDSRITLKVFDISGREVTTLLNDKNFTAGAHAVNFNGDELSSGVYFYRIEVMNSGKSIFSQSKKMLLLK